MNDLAKGIEKECCRCKKKDKELMYCSSCYVEAIERMTKICLELQRMIIEKHSSKEGK